MPALHAGLRVQNITIHPLSIYFSVLLKAHLPTASRAWHSLLVCARRNLAYATHATGLPHSQTKHAAVSNSQFFFAPFFRFPFARGAATTTPGVRFVQNRRDYGHGSRSSRLCGIYVSGTGSGSDPGVLHCDSSARRSLQSSGVFFSATTAATTREV